MYECHLTFDSLSNAQLRTLEAYARLCGWKTSFIDGDPALGPGKRFFLTDHNKDAKALFTRMTQAKAGLFLKGISPVREKIEHIIHDTKYDIKIELPHLCTSCKIVELDPQNPSPTCWHCNNLMVDKE